MSGPMCARLVAVLALCLSLACGDADRLGDAVDSTMVLDCRAFYHHDEPLEGVPADFRAVYGFLTGTSVGPVSSYSYDIVINSDAADTIFMELGVFGFVVDPVSRAEAFDASLDDMDALYSLMLDQDIFREYWEWLPQDEWPCGAPGRSLWVRADSGSYHVYGFIVEEDVVMPVYSMMTLLVPQSIWDELWAWRDEFIADQP